MVDLQSADIADSSRNPSKTGFENMLCQEIYNVFLEPDLNCFKKSVSFRGWDICEKPHEDETELVCESFKPYCAAQSSNSDSPPLSPKRQAAHLRERSASAYSFNNKSPRKSPPRPNTGTGNIRRSKSSKCLPITAVPAIGPFTKPQRAVNGDGGSPVGSNSTRGSPQQSPESSQKQPNRFASFNSTKEIYYEFRHFLCHQLHIDAYRKSHTYVLIRKYRELRASGFVGYKLQAALRLNLASSALHRLHNEAAKRLYFESLIGKASPGKEKSKKRDPDEKRKVDTSDAHLQCMIETELPRTLEQPIMQRKSFMNALQVPADNLSEARAPCCLLPDEKAPGDRGCRSALPLDSVSIYRTLSTIQRPNTTTIVPTKLTARMRSFVVDEKYHRTRKNSVPVAASGLRRRLAEAEKQEKEIRQRDSKMLSNEEKKTQLVKNTANKLEKNTNSGNRNCAKNHIINARLNSSSGALKPVVPKSQSHPRSAKEPAQNKAPIADTSPTAKLAIASSSRTVISPYSKPDDVIEDVICLL